MRKITLLCLLCLVLGLGSAWANTGSINPNNFTNPVDWCTNYGCVGALLGTPTPWFANVAPNTGWVGLISSQNMENRQQGPTSWNGNFSANMGLIYNGVTTLGNTPGGILVSFDQPVFGAGAYIQPDWYGSFTGTITLYDSSFTQLGSSFSHAGVSDTNVGTALFIGAYDGVADVSYAVFDTYGVGGDDNLAIGTLRLATSPVSTVPEPSTLLLVAPSMLGLAGVVRRRISRKEVL